jgi:hypothetical protein
MIFIGNRKKKELGQLNLSHEMLQKKSWDIIGNFGIRTYSRLLMVRKD